MLYQKIDRTRIVSIRNSLYKEQSIFYKEQSLYGPSQLVGSTLELMQRDCLNTPSCAASKEPHLLPTRNRDSTGVSQVPNNKQLGRTKEYVSNLEQGKILSNKTKCLAQTTGALYLHVGNDSRPKTHSLRPCKGGRLWKTAFPTHILTN